MLFMGKIVYQQLFSEFVFPDQRDSQIDSYYLILQ